ncbi:MAG: hypothetical protein ACKOX6_00760 [Bdellovibrio sp.]
MKAKLLALALTVASSTTFAGPILIFTDVKQPSLVREHFTSGSWTVTDNITELSYHETGIVANGQSYSWDGSDIGYVFLSYTADGEPTSANYIGAALGSDSTRSLLRGPFAPDPGQFFSSVQLPGAQHSQLVFTTQPRVWQDPAQHGLPGDGVIRDGMVAASSVAVPEPSVWFGVAWGLLSICYLGRFKGAKVNG